MNSQSLGREDQTQAWQFESLDPNRLTTGGDLGRLFRGESVSKPHFFVENAPADEAILLAREATQNAWDNALEMRDTWYKFADTPPQFTLTYRFLRIEGPSKQSLVKALGLHDLRDHYDAIHAGSRGTDIGLPPDNCLEHLDDSLPLRLLQIIEQGSGGMFGKWRTDESRMFRALRTQGLSNPYGESGGSFGYGKAALIRASALRTIVAYSCFREYLEPIGDEEPEPDITRRLLGAAFWRPHHANGISYNGYGTFARSTEPYANGEADAHASAMHIPIRNPAHERDRGTTITIVDPTVSPHHLRRAIEQYWWPALEQKGLQFSVHIIDENDNPLTPRPGEDPLLEPFMRTFEVARMPPDRRREEIRRFKVLRPGTKNRASTPPAGTMALTHERIGWSNPTGGSQAEDHRSVVALMRKTRMVIEYYDAGSSPPYVRGTFVADDSINESLKNTEPKAHDEWQVSPSDDIPTADSQLAAHILKRIKTNVNAYRKCINPPPPRRDGFRLPLLDQLLGGLRTGGTNPGPDPGPSSTRALRISRDAWPTWKNGRRVIKGEAVISYNPDTDAGQSLPDQVTVIVHIVFHWKDKDERPGKAEGDELLLLIREPGGFQPTEDKEDQYVGTLTPADEVRFEFETEPFEDEWSAMIDVLATIVGASPGSTVETLASGP